MVFSLPYVPGGGQVSPVLTASQPQSMLNRHGVGWLDEGWGQESLPYYRHHSEVLCGSV